MRAAGALFALFAVLASVIVMGQPSPGVSDEPTHVELIAQEWPTLDAALAGDPLPDLVGMWSGTWTDTMFTVGGAITMDITQNGNMLSGTGTIDLTSIGFFGIGVMSGSATGTITGVWNAGAGTLTLTGSDTLANFENIENRLQKTNLIE